MLRELMGGVSDGVVIRVNVQMEAPLAAPRRCIDGPGKAKLWLEEKNMADGC
jgi:hypothetical protein